MSHDPAFDPALVHALAAVLREGSFERAARGLAITPSALSQRIKLLEERIGSVLVVRGQPARATPIGARLARHAEALSLLEASLRAELGAEAPPVNRRAAVAARLPPPRLRLAVNADSLGTWFIEALARFQQQHPGGIPAQIEVLVDDQDHTSEWLRRGEVLAAVTASAEPVQGCRSHALGSLRYAATASPAYMQRWFAAGVSASALAEAPLLQFNTKDRLQERFVRRITRRELHPPVHRLPSTQAFVDAALAGLGWGMNPLGLVREHLAAGRLQELLPGRTQEVRLHWQVTRLALPQVEALTRAVLAVAREVLG